MTHRTASDPVLVTSPAEMAAFLHAASPRHARAGAVVAHERACRSGDEDRMAFWLGVMNALQALAGTAVPDASAVPAPSGFRRPHRSDARLAVPREPAPSAGVG